MKPIIEKVLKSGLVDKHMVEMMEKFGQLPPGSVDLVREDALKDATKNQLYKLAEEIGNEVDKERTLRETQLDLDKVRWPALVNQITTDKGEALALQVPCVIDRMGRLYFRIQDVNEAWFVPGYTLTRTELDKTRVGYLNEFKDQIIESSVLYADSTPVCVQVSVHRLA